MLPGALVLIMMSCFNFVLAKNKNSRFIYSGIGCLFLALFLLIVESMNIN